MSDRSAEPVVVTCDKCEGLGVMKQSEAVNSNEWLPCPFCGDRDIHFYDNPMGWSVECGSCPTELRWFSTKADALLRWNKRPAAETASPQAPIARVTIKDGMPIRTAQYAPGLPDGEHDIYCEPEATAPMMRAETKDYRNWPREPPHCPSCACGMPAETPEALKLLRIIVDNHDAFTSDDWDAMDRRILAVLSPKASAPHIHDFTTASGFHSSVCQTCGAPERPPCGPDDHKYSCVAGTPIGEAYCVFCGAKEPPDDESPDPRGCRNE